MLDGEDRQNHDPGADPAASLDSDRHRLDRAALFRGADLVNRSNDAHELSDPHVVADAEACGTIEKETDINKYFINHRHVGESEVAFLAKCRRLLLGRNQAVAARFFG